MSHDATSHTVFERLCNIIRSQVLVLSVTLHQRCVRPTIFSRPY